MNFQKLLVIAILLYCNHSCIGQSQRSSEKGFSLYIGYTSNKTAHGGLGYVKNKNSYSLGFSSQQNGQKGKAVSERLENYGNATSGTGVYIQGLDGTYERFISNTIALGVVATVGIEKSFTNYQDDRFTDDAYHYITNKKTVGGFGGYMAYYFNGGIGLSAGYHSLKQVSFVLHIRLAN